MAISGHFQIDHRGGLRANGIAKVQAQTRFPFELLEQQSHQRPVLQNPAHSICSTGLRAAGPITRQERHLPLQSLIAELQEAKRRQIRQQSLPEIQALQQLSAGVGEGVGAAALQQSRGGQGIPQLHHPATARQG